MKYLKLPSNLHQAGQALVTLILFTVIGMTITGAAVAVAVTVAKGSSSYAQSEEALRAAEAGAENAMIKLVRNPAYAGEAGLAIGTSTVTITVSGTTTKTIVASAVNGTIVRNVQVVGTFSGGTFTQTSWTEIN